MRVELLTLSLFGLAWCGPARRDCGQEKCYTAVNECSMTYGGCWTECANGITEIPTFTVPPCSSTPNTAISSAVGYPTGSSLATLDAPSPTVDVPAQPLITPPPSVNSSAYPTLDGSVSSTCAPLWLCKDYIAVCETLTQWYGGCYDTCTSAPPFSSPPCSLSSTTTAAVHATNTPTHAPGAAYTENPASDDIGSAVDDSKALVMAEMPNADAPATTPTPAPDATTSDADEPTATQVQKDEPEATTPVIVSDPVEAPGGVGTLRGAAIAKIKADKDRKPKTANVPCYDDPFCKEVQLEPSQ